MPKNKSKKKRSTEVYAKEEPSNRFKNDGSFMETFKRMAERTQQTQQHYQQQQFYEHQSSEGQERELNTGVSPDDASTYERATANDSDEPYVAPQSVTYKSGSSDRKSQQVKIILVTIAIATDLAVIYLKSSPHLSSLVA